MKKYLLSLLLLAVSVLGQAQTATDFTANDCIGGSHNLFTELNSGKVIVLCWVMPCSACIGSALTTNNVVQSYQAANPNTVYFYLCDDYGNSSCSTLNSWATAGGIPQSASSLRFSNAAINMSNYGSTGMPKIVVLGGVNHTVFYNVNNSVNSTNLQNAINTALNSTGIEESNSSISALNIFPNPAAGSSEIKFNLREKSDVSIELFNLEGQLISKIFAGMLTAGENKMDLDVSNLASGMYLVKLSVGNKNSFINLVVSH